MDTGKKLTVSGTLHFPSFYLEFHHLNSLGILFLSVHSQNKTVPSLDPHDLLTLMSALCSVSTPCLVDEELRITFPVFFTTWCF